MSKVSPEQIRSAAVSVAQLIALKTGVNDSMVAIFADFESVVEHLMRGSSPGTGRIVTGGIVTPDIQLLAHKAGKKLIELVGTSAFSSDVDAVLAEIKNPAETVYLANPNRISGTDWSLADLEQIARAIPDGLLIVDEYYYDYYGISADPLLTRYSNVVVLRSPAVAAGIPATFGYLIASPYRVDQLVQERVTGTISESELSILTECLYNVERLYQKLRTAHEEALRMIGSLRGRGFRCRLTPYDRLVVQVANPAVAGNHLATHKVEVENLDGYPGMKNHIRVAVGARSANDRTIEALGQLAPGGLATAGKSKQKLEIRRTPEQSIVEELRLPPTRTERVKVFALDSAESEKVVPR